MSNDAVVSSHGPFIRGADPFRQFELSNGAMLSPAARLFIEAVRLVARPLAKGTRR